MDKADVLPYKDDKIPFEEALHKTGFGLYNYLLTGLVGLSTISFVTLAYCSSIIVPTSACELETTTAQQGLVVAVPIAGGIVGSLVWGFLGDTRGRRKMLLASLCCGATSNALASLSVNWVMLMVLQFCTVALGSGIYTLSMTLLSESVPLAKRNFIMLLVSSIFLLGQGIMSVMAIPIIPLRFSHYLSALDIYWNSWRTLQLTYSLPSLICIVWLLFMQESPKFILAKGDEEGALTILRRIHRINKGRRAEELQVKGLLGEAALSDENKPKAKDQIMPLFKAPYLKYTLIMASLFILFQTLVSLLVWLPTIANQFIQMMQAGEASDFTMCEILDASGDMTVDPDAVPCSLNTIALLILLVICSLHSIFNTLLSLIVNKTGRRNTTMVITAVCGLAGILVNLVPNAIGSAIFCVVFSMGIVVLGFYTAMSVALFPTNLRTMAVAMTMTGGRIVSVGLIQIVNYLLVNSCSLGFYLLGALFASSALVLALLPDDRLIFRPKPDTEASTPQEENAEAKE
ncbi:hypothetical protein MSG28_008285 [Choristoneura fumiferana]|uniref:Uncharacterized protein n=1 Tax=Choristoneura fumiferana TaxID=7141 RepID=A0ACC0JAR2_CHOFU|nr:hypothetical protein MSG28_008285 [Choristoneura fumiferana]